MYNPTLFSNLHVSFIKNKGGKNIPVYRYVILSGCHCPFSVVDISITRSNEFIQYKWKWEHFEMHLLQVMGHSQSTLLNNTSPYQCQVSVLVSCCIKIMVCFLSHFHLWSSDSLKMPTGACQILPKLCIFGGSTTGAAIFLESPSNLDLKKWHLTSYVVSEFYLEEVEIFSIWWHYFYLHKLIGLSTVRCSCYSRIEKYSCFLQMDRVYLSSPNRIAVLDHERKRTYLIRKEGLPDTGEYLQFNMEGDNALIWKYPLTFVVP